MTPHQKENYKSFIEQKYLQSPTGTIVGTVLNESDDLAIFGVTFYSKMTFGSIFAHFP